MKTKTYAFGPFELDSAQQQLRRRGLRLKLPASRIRLLLLFVHRRGELITREEIAACLWSDSKAADVITGINTAMNQLRSQLGDDPAAPKYIETVIGTGYRFIAKVTEIEAPAQTSSAPVSQATEFEPDPEPSSADESSNAASVTSQPGESGHRARLEVQPGTRRSRPGKTIAIASAAAIVLSACALFLLYQRANAHRTAPDAELELNRVTTSGDIQSADISPDGNFVAYVRQSGGQQTLWLKQLATDQLLQIASLGNYQCPGLAFSADGSYVYFVRKQLLEPVGELYRVPFLGGSAVKVLDGVSGAPAISPDGRTVAFVRSTLVTHGKDSIVTAALDGSGEKTLVSYDAPGIHFNRVTWTADGRSLVYPLQSGLMVIPASGGAAQPIAGEPWSDINDVWRLPPDSDLVVVGELRGSKRSQIFEVSWADGKTFPISHDLSNYLTVRPTADGKALLAVQHLTLSNIQILAPGGGPSGLAVQPLSAENQNSEGVEGLGWTPDGKIIYLSATEQETALMESDGSSSSPRRIGTSDTLVGRFSNPVPSPQGEFIAVTRWQEHDRANIWRVDMDGSNEKRLTDGLQDFPPSITPDGKWIVYASVQGDRSVLMKVPSEGGAAIKLTDYNADFPSVSPDGQWIACSYIASADQPPSLAIVPIAGGPPARVFQLPDTATLPPLAWTPDGRAVSFISDVNGVGNIWQQPVGGGLPTQVTNFTSGKLFSFQWSRDGRLALSRGTQPTDAVLIRNFRGSKD